MLFQTLDDKEDCVSVYVGGEMMPYLPPDISRTWSYSNFLIDKDVDYAQIYCGGQSLNDVCPVHLLPIWQKIHDSLKAYYRSFSTSKISLNENCFFDMVPKRFLMEYCEVKNEICEWVFQKYDRPANYNLLVNAQKVISDMKYRQLNIDVSYMKKHFHEKKARDLMQEYSKREAYCDFNLFGSKTGRLATMPNSFPIHNLKKEYRGMINCNNDFFIELDYNAAEARVVLGLMGKEQPGQDIHEWHASTIYRGLLTRNDAKTRFFSWLYNPESEDYLSNREYDRQSLLREYYKNSKISTVFDRSINCDKAHAFNYLIQSTCADMVLEKMYNVFDLLRDRKSYIAFTLHDSIIIDFSSKDKDLLPFILTEFQNTRFGRFKISVHAGENYGNLKKIK